MATVARVSSCMDQYRYKVTLERVAGKDGEVRGNANDSLSFEAYNHDDLFQIVERQKSKGIWDDNTAAQLAIGFKMFAEVALHHRADPLFEPLMPHIRDFIGRLKALRAHE